MLKRRRKKNDSSSRNIILYTPNNACVYSKLHVHKYVERLNKRDCLLILCKRIISYEDLFLQDNNIRTKLSIVSSTLDETIVDNYIIHTMIPIYFNQTWPDR